MLIRPSFRLLCRTAHGSKFSSLSLSSQPMEVACSPGARSIELRQAESGNLLTNSLVTMLQSKLELFKDNVTADALFFYSPSEGGNFSLGIANEDFKPDKKKYCAAVNKVAASLATYPKPTVTIFSGHSTGTGFGVFSGSKFRLGTPSASFAISELHEGRIPLGALARSFAKGSSVGVEFARFLAISGRRIEATDMYALGLITHFVHEDPHDDLVAALAHSYPEEWSRSALVQTSAVDVSGLSDLIDTMHIESDMDCLSHKAWNEYLLVPFQEWRGEYADVMNLNSSLHELAPFVKQCFSSDQVDHSKVALQEIVSRESSTALGRLAQDTLENISKLEANSPTLLRDWYSHTRHSANSKDLGDVLRQEVLLNSK